MPTYGILHDFRRPSGDGYVDYYRECLAEIELADELGYDTVWLSEHHLTPDGLSPAPLVLAAAIAARTTRIRIGTSVLVLPLHHPLRVAEEAAAVDLLSGGRLVLGVGQGYAEREFAAFGVPRADRARLLDEGVAFLRSALAGESVTPTPRRPVPLYVGGVTAAGLRRAARLGDGVIIYCATPADLRARRALLDTVAPDVPLICTSVVHVAEDADQAWMEAAPAIAYLEGQIGTYAGRSDTPVLKREDYLVGTPSEVADRLADLAGELRLEHFAHWARLPGLSHQRALSSLRLLAKEVLPTVGSGVK